LSPNVFFLYRLHWYCIRWKVVSHAYGQVHVIRYVQSFRNPWNSSEVQWDRVCAPFPSSVSYPNRLENLCLQAAGFAGDLAGVG